MFARVIQMQYWKSEHEEQTCEDAYGESVTDGLFAIADGAGTTLFSNIWAKILIQSFLSVPILNNDPFEFEWWVRRAQDQFKQKTPDPGTMAWNAMQKAQNQGSYATLATLRFSKSETNQAQANLLVIGDSCILTHFVRSGQIQSFRLDNPTEFEQAPICIPSKRSNFHRYFHRCYVKHVEFEAGDIIVLATDAVSKWVISAGSGRYTTMQDAFQALITQTPATWSTFIEECRSRDEMIDDDSTAMIINLTSDAVDGAVPLGITIQHSKAIRKSRLQEFTSAVETKNKELIAITYGDGVDLSLEGVTIQQEAIQKAREVADALQNVLQKLRQEINGPDVAVKVGPVWQQYAHLLSEEPCAANLRQTLERIGVPAKQLEKSQPQSDLLSEKQSVQSELAKLHREREQLELERRFVNALHGNDDIAIIASFNEIQRSPYAQSFIFLPLEKQRINLAYQQVRSKEYNQAISNQMANTATDHKPESSFQQGKAEHIEKRSWLRKLIKWKGPQHA